MDKGTPYETFQFIENTESNPDMTQLLVLQDDGSLLSVNSDIQYITQVQQVKEATGDVQTCAVFDVSSQHFYMDVDNQFEISHGDGNVYSQFLIQPETSAASEPMESDTAVPSLESDAQSEADLTNTNAANSSTEITLTDAQYNVLEEKGWILLEFSGRIFVLDTLGLHDITTDEKLIEKLKSEHDGSATQQIDPGQITTGDAASSGENIVKIEYAEIETEEQPFVESTKSTTKIETSQLVIEHLEKSNLQQSSEVIEKPNLDLQHSVPTSNFTDRKCNSIKIKTKYTFSDIPDKIFLGRTVNGKKLYAKVTKSKHKEISNMELAKCAKSFEKDKNIDAIDDDHFISIIEEYIREPPARVQVNEVVAAVTLLTQLMRIAHIKDTVMGNCVVITKTVIFVTADGKEKTRREPTAMTGEVKPLDDKHSRFVHTPYILQNMACTGAPHVESTERSELSVASMTQSVVRLAHIHITETKTPRKPSVQSITVCNRKISLDVIRDVKKRDTKPVYACGACAAVFTSQCTLDDHLQEHSLGAADQDDALSIDTEQPREQTSYYTLNIGKEKWYICLQCEERFSKLFNCKMHVKSHSRPTKLNEASDEASHSTIKEYKCTMCPSKYFHASSLSKHLLKRHIQVRTNKHT